MIKSVTVNDFEDTITIVDNIKLLKHQTAVESRIHDLLLMLLCCFKLTNDKPEYSLSSHPESSFSSFQSV